MSQLDVITLGEALFRLTPPDLRLIAQTDTLNLEVGGSEANTAVGLSRLGMNVAWLSRLTDNPLGRRIEQSLNAQKVNTSHIIWTESDRIGLYFLEDGHPPRGGNVTYDRANSSMSNMTVDDLPESLFTPEGGRLLHLTGITLALSESASDTVHYAFKLAKEAGWTTTFDLNYRSKLWLPTEATVRCEQLALEADIVILPERDARLLYNLSGNVDDILNALYERWGNNIVLTRGSAGVDAITEHGQLLHQDTFPAESVGRIGGGDAFDAGLIYGYLTDGDLETALRWGTASAAYKYSIPGDLALIDAKRVAEMVAGDGKSNLNR